MIISLLAGIFLTPLRQDGIREIQDVEFLRPGSPYKLDIYLPRKPVDGSALPAVVWIHGGGWETGSRRGPIDIDACRTLAANGLVAVSVDYHLGAGAWPQNLRDCKVAVRFVRKFADRFNVDPSRIAVAGASAGGHLALMVGLTAGIDALEPQVMYPGVSNAVRGVVDLYGPTDLQADHLRDQPHMLDLLRRRGRSFGTNPRDDVFRVASPISYISRNAPPTLIIHGHDDRIVDVAQSIKFAELLRHQRAPVETLYLDGVGHAFGLQSLDGRPLPRDLRPVVLNFLEKILASTKR